jgi:leucyl aminopeptidase
MSDSEVVQIAPSVAVRIVAAPGRRRHLVEAADQGLLGAVMRTAGNAAEGPAGGAAGAFARGAGVGAALRQAERAAVASTRDLRGRERRDFITGLLLGAYDPRPRPWHREITLFVQPSAVPAVRRQVLRLAGVWAARRLADLPASAKPPQVLAGEIERLALRAGVGAEVLDEHDLADLGAGGILAVGGGSSAPPRLVVLRWRPARPRRRVVLVGKGITFDSGGLSLKPAGAMALMKTDMSGAAAVSAAVVTAAHLQLPVAVTAYLPLAENAVSGAAMRPGDVIEHVGGRTSEVRNTDAEGRLVLADALALVARQERYDAVVDVATLTGAATAALSRRVGAVLGRSDGLAAALQRAGAAGGEPVWRLPLVPEYAAAIASDVADAANSSTDPGNSAGAITAAWFLEPFAAGRWAHLDIAGPARAESARPGQGKGATGFGARLLVAWLEAVAAGRGW